MSGYAQLNGHFYFNITSLAPPGTRIITHEKPDQRESWDPQGLDGHYLGPALDHYRCYQVHITKTKGTRIVDTVEPPPRKTGNSKHVIKRPCQHCSIRTLQCTAKSSASGAV
jgi:hypothetical protein